MYTIIQTYIISQCVVVVVAVAVAVAVAVVVVVTAHTSSCSLGTHLHQQIDRQAPINKTNVIASPSCQLQVAQTRN